jgi:hypothetical protein
MTITLLQGPKTAREVARQIRAWALSTSQDQEDAPEPMFDEDDEPTQGITIISRTSKGELRLEISADTDIDTIVSLLDRAIFHERHAPIP